MSNFSFPNAPSDLYHIVSISLQCKGATRHLDAGWGRKRGNSAWTRSSCKTGRTWPLMTPHTHSQPIAPTAHNVSVFMEDDKGLSHCHQTGIAFKLSLRLSSSEQAAAPKPTLPHTGLSHLLVTASEQNFCSYLQCSPLKSLHFAHTSHVSLALTLWASCVQSS